MIQLILDKQNAELFSARLGIDFGQVCHTLELTNILLNNYIKWILSVNSLITIFLAILEVQCEEFFSIHGRIIL